MTERMPLDNLDEFEGADYHPMAPDGHVAAVGTNELAKQLQGYREAAALTQTYTATLLDWSYSKVSRIEAARVRPLLSDVRALLSTYGVTDENEVADVAAMARANRKARRTTTYNDVISPEYRDYLEYEAAASELAVYSSTFVPGILRTAAYNRSLERTLNLSNPKQDEERLALQTKFLRERAAYLLGPHGPALRIILDENVFYRPIGNEGLPSEHAYNEVTAIIKGLQRLDSRGSKGRSATTRLNPDVAIQIAPSRLDTLAMRGYPFSVANIQGQPAATHAEATVGNINSCGVSDETRAYQTAFDRVSGMIPGPQHTNRILDAILEAAAKGGPIPVLALRERTLLASREP